MKTMGKSGLGRKKICTLRWTETRQPGTETGFVWGQFQPDPVYSNYYDTEGINNFDLKKYCNSQKSFYAA